jgi:hypothetical protein
MPAKQPPYVPRTRDEVVRERTGRTWAEWFALLDRAGGATLGHRELTRVLVARQVSAWWSQMVAVEYERARGLRRVHESAGGYAVSVSRTVAWKLPQLYGLTARPAARRKWFPRGEFQPSSQTKDKYLRGPWKGGARLEIGFYARGPAKSQISVQVSRLARRADVETVRETWKAALTRLQGLGPADSARSAPGAKADADSAPGARRKK